ncbi:hypothetical protein PMAYCL1PPCAC_27437, partial [Pristionchus mayeri]
VQIELFSSNLPFYNLSYLNWSLFERYGSSLEPKLLVTLSGPNDPVVEQVSSFLSATINDSGIDDINNIFSPADLSLCLQLLRGSTLGCIFVECELDDTTVSSFIEIASRAKEFELCSFKESQLSDPAAFVTQLASMDFTRVFLSDPF